MKQFISIDGLIAAGGDLLAAELANRLGYKLIDRKILFEIAKELDTHPEKLVADIKNESKNWISKLASKIEKSLVSMNFSAQPGYLYFGPHVEFLMGSAYADIAADEDNVDYLAFVRATKEVIYKIGSANEQVVVVGRGSGIILSEFSCNLSIFLHADINNRVMRLKSRRGYQTDEEAKKYLEEADKSQKHYFNKAFGIQLGNCFPYELSFNSAKITIVKIADLVCEYLAREKDNEKE